MSSFFHGRNRFNRHILRKITMVVVIGFLCMFMLISAGSYFQSKMNLSSTTLQQWTTHISFESFVAALSMEIPALNTYNKSVGVQPPQAASIAFEMVTSFNPEDPRTLIRRELPGFAFFDGEVVVAGQGIHYTDVPIESAPPMEVLLAEREAVIEQMNGDSGEANATEETEETEHPPLTTEGREVVFIYHTHNRESWLPHVPSAESPNEAFHPEVNITLVGERLAEELERRGIGSVVDTSDITQQLQENDMSYSHSYAKSRDVVETAMSEHDDIHFIFDLHRDALGRDRTTVEIDGEDYARTYFVIGGRNPDHEQNLQFAEMFHDKLEEAYPGLSRGVFLKEGGDGEYNQSLSENNVLIEIGGVENNLEESYRTAEALADVIADLYWEDEKVGGSVQE